MTYPHVCGQEMVVEGRGVSPRDLPIDVYTYPHKPKGCSP